MPYDGSRSWGQFEAQVQNRGYKLFEEVKRGEELYRDLLVYAEGKTNAQIATDLAVAEAWVDDLQAALVAYHRIYEFCEGSTTVQRGAYFDAIRKFT